MKKILISLFALINFTACKDREEYMDAVTKIQYQSNIGSYSNYYIPNTKKGTTELIAAHSFSYQISSDSVCIGYRSYIADAMGSLATLTLFKKYSKNDLDSSESRWIPKTDALFYDVFKTGKLKIKWYSNSDPQYEGADIDLTKNSERYIYQNSPLSGLNIPIPSYQDPANEFEIVNINTSREWFTFAYRDVPASEQARKVMVEIKFKCKLYKVTSPHDEALITEGTFQSYFADR